MRKHHVPFAQALPAAALILSIAAFAPAQSAAPVAAQAAAQTAARAGAQAAPPPAAGDTRRITIAFALTASPR